MLVVYACVAPTNRSPTPALPNRANCLDGATTGELDSGKSCQRGRTTDVRTGRQSPGPGVAVSLEVLGGDVVHDTTPGPIFYCLSNVSGPENLGALVVQHS